VICKFIKGDAKKGRLYLKKEIAVKQVRKKKRWSVESYYWKRKGEEQKTFHPATDAW
jgi:hypothetical protein